MKTEIKEGKKVLIPSGFFTKSTGGSNRNWTNRYRAMHDKHKLLLEVNDHTERMANIIKGYEMCMQTFENWKK